MYECVLEIWLAGEHASAFSDEVTWDRGRMTTGLLELVAAGDRVVLSRDEADDPSLTPSFAALPLPWQHDYVLCGPANPHPRFDESGLVLPALDWVPQRTIRVSIAHDGADIRVTWPCRRNDVRLPADLHAATECWVARLREWSTVPLGSHEAAATTSDHELIDLAASASVHLRDGADRPLPTVVEVDAGSSAGGPWAIPDDGDRSVILFRPRPAQRRLIRGDVPAQRADAPRAAQLIQASSPFVRAWRVDPDRTRPARACDPCDELVLVDDRMRIETRDDAPTVVLFDAQVTGQVVRLGITLPFDDEYRAVLSEAESKRVTTLVEGIRSSGYGDMVLANSFGSAPIELGSVSALVRLLGRA